MEVEIASSGVLGIILLFGVGIWLVFVLLYLQTIMSSVNIIKDKLLER